MSVHDPEAMDNVRNYFSGDKDVMRFLHFVEDPYEAIQGADLLALVTEWSEYLEVDFDRLSEEMNVYCVADGRNCFDLEDMKKKGCHYVSIGRPEVGGG